MVSAENETIDGQAAEAASPIELHLTVEEARVLREVAKRGMMVAGAAGNGPDGNPSQAKAALEKLDDAVAEADRISSLRSELELAGLATAHLGDAQVTSLARRLADLSDPS